MRVISKIIGIALLVVLFCSCYGRLVEFPIQDPNRKIDLNSGRLVMGPEVCGYQILLFIPINVNERQKRALYLLQKKVPDEYITDIEIKESWRYILIGTGYCTQMRGTAYKYLESK